MDHRCLATIKGERGAHICCSIVVGDYLYAGMSSSNGPSDNSASIRVWQNKTLNECGGFGRGYGAAKALIVAGDWVISAHQDLKIRVWSRGPAGNRHRRRLEQVAEVDGLHPRAVALQEVEANMLHSVENSHKLLASMPTVKDYIKSFFPPKNYVQVRRHHKRLWIEHVDTISMLAMGGSASDPLLYSASWDRTIKVWKLSDFKCIESFKAHDDAINALLVASAGFLYSASTDAKVKVWERQGGTAKHSLVACLEAHKSAVNALALSNDGPDQAGVAGHETLYSAGCDKGIVVWERVAAESTQQHMAATEILQGHQQAVLCMVSRDSVLCSGSADHTIRVWCRAPYGKGRQLAHSCVAVLRGHRAPVKCLSLTCNDSTKDRYLVHSSSLDHEIKVWEFSENVKKGEEQFISKEPN